MNRKSKYSGFFCLHQCIAPLIAHRGSLGESERISCSKFEKTAVERIFGLCHKQFIVSFDIGNETSGIAKKIGGRFQQHPVFFLKTKNIMKWRRQNFSFPLVNIISPSSAKQQNSVPSFSKNQRPLTACFSKRHLRLAVLRKAVIVISDFLVAMQYTGLHMIASSMSCYRKSTQRRVKKHPQKFLPWLKYFRSLYFL